MNKTTEQLIEEFLAKGGKIEKIPYVDPDNSQTIGSTNKKVPQIMTLAEGEELFGEKQKRKKKIKEQDFSSIDLDLIPEHLHHIIKKPASDKQVGDHKGGNESETN